ncbi:uncharacterized protein LOC134178500 [Corticium candelabrum]|uniref:uncharacterized protein LOC134178500 n=1 Tax=Corticium candelabrum TaxID=121492 RepID=UPI002E266C2D|nr:uncharacterized protein LOC134178500 [Corticium candelabrum]
MLTRQKRCSVCRRPLCSDCSKQRRHISGRQSSLAVSVCTECSLTLDETEANKWMQQFSRYLLQEDKTSFAAACGCVAMAICSSNDWTTVLLSLTKHLIQNNWPEMGLRLIAPLLVNKNVSSKDYVKALMLLASALEKSFARQPHLKFMYYQYDMLLAAKEAYVTAESVLEDVDDHTLEPLQISQKKLELDSTVRKLSEEREKRMYSETSKRIAQLWESREWESLLSMLKAKINSNDPQSHKQTDRIVMHAFENFLNGKKDYLDKMLKEDRSGLLVLRGLWEIKRQDVTAGLCDVQTAVWNGIHLECLLKAAINVAVDLTDSDVSDSLNQRFKVIFSGIKHSSARDLLRSAIDSNLFGLLPTDDDLIPPSTLNWPELVVPGINARATRKYEESVRRHISEGKWSERNAAVAYIDLVSSSNHPAEAVVSYVIAGLWFLKELRLAVENQESQAAEKRLAGNTKSDSIKSSGKDSRPSDEFRNVFAIEQAVVGCMKRAYLLATTVLHPGMQLYVFRLALKATVSAVHLVNERATPDIDGKLQDASENDDYESPEAQFAADFTTHYDEIARYFPLFARLKELVKLQFFAAVVHSQLEDLMRKSDEDAPVPDSIIQTIQEEQRRKRKEAVLQGLPQIKSQIGVWPAAENEFEITSAVRRIENELPFSYSRLYVPDSDIELEVKKVLRERDQTVLSDITSNLMQVCRSEVCFGTLKTMVSRWLSSNASTNSLDNLVQFIDKNMRVFTRAEIQQKKANELKAAHRSFEEEVIVMKRRKQRNEQSVTACKWVPAALLRQPNSNGGFRLCYGGVMLTPTCREGVVVQTDSRDENIQTISSRNIDTFLAASNDQVKSNRSSYTAPKSNTTDSESSRPSSVLLAAGLAAAAAAGSRGDGGDGGDGDSSSDDSDSSSTCSDENDGNGESVMRKPPIWLKLYWNYVNSLTRSKMSLAGAAECLTNFLKRFSYEKSEQFETHLDSALQILVEERRIVRRGENTTLEFEGRENVVDLLFELLSSKRYQILWCDNAHLWMPVDDQVTYSSLLREFRLMGRNFSHSGRPDLVVAILDEHGACVGYQIVEFKICILKKEGYSYFVKDCNFHPDETPVPKQKRRCFCETLDHYINRAEDQVTGYCKYFSWMLKDKQLSSIQVSSQVAVMVLEEQSNKEYAFVDFKTTETKLYNP